MELLLVWTSVVIVCSLVSSVELRSIQSTLSDQDLISAPGVHYTVKIPPTIPSTSSHPPPLLLLSLPGPLNPAVMMRAKSPSPEVPDNVQIRVNQSTMTEPATPQERPTFRPHTGQLQPAVNDPANSSARPALLKGMMVVGLNSGKKLPPTSKLAGVIRGIYWMLDTVSPLQTDLGNQKSVSEAEKWIKDVKTHRKVVRIEVEEERCGRNHLVHFDDGTVACAKQRRNYDQIQGEIFAYFLADLLQMRHHLPPTVLVKAVHSRLFEPVMEQVQQSATWDPTRPFILTKYLTNLKPLLLPPILHPLMKSIVRQTQEASQTTPATSQADSQAAAGNDTVDSSETTLTYPLISPRSQQLGQLTKPELRELLQWSDLVIFDYLSGNLDRIVNSAVNLQWHQGMLSLPVHNVYQTSTESGSNFIFMDNESGLFHGYRLLDQYDRYLQPLLRSFCVFNKSTVNAIKRLHHSRNAGTQMMKMMAGEYPRLLNRLPGIGPKTSQILQKRLRYVYTHIRFCEDNYFLP